MKVFRVGKAGTFLTRKLALRGQYARNGGFLIPSGQFGWASRAGSKILGLSMLWWSRQFVTQELKQLVCSIFWERKLLNIVNLTASFPNNGIGLKS